MKKVLIVGGGIAGLSAAIQLEKRGYEVEIAEQTKKWETIGAGIVLWPNALKVLQSCTIREDVENRGNILKEFHVSDTNGRQINRFDFRDFPDMKKLYAIAIARTELHDALIGGVKSSKIILGTSIEQIIDKGEKAEVQFTNDTVFEYDFIIGADGIHSKVRSLIFGETKPRYSNHAGWRFITNGLGQSNTACEVWGNGKRFGIVPIKNGKYYCFSTINTSSNNQDYKNISISDYRKLYSELGWETKEILDTLTEDVKLIYDDLFDFKIKSWHKGNVVLIGDAAHAVTPNLGSGAAMALEDSVCLAEALSRCSNLHSAFEQYFSQRYKRVRFIREASYWFGERGQLTGIFARLRDITVRSAGRMITPFIIRKIVGF
jgi:2-polyprenyl-6-methoxyphenol hydroxylase-like FAD-dependent oxidoreductase